MRGFAATQRSRRGWNGFRTDVTARDVLTSWCLRFEAVPSDDVIDRGAPTCAARAMVAR